MIVAFRASLGVWVVVGFITLLIRELPGLDVKVAERITTKPIWAAVALQAVVIAIGIFFLTLKDWIDMAVFLPFLAFGAFLAGGAVGLPILWLIDWIRGCLAKDK
jgi:hypothetical protein